ncbi:MAG: DUF2799 domain-containing protein [Gammaproteobacteria bacterium]|nr:DUF2799 domain-containing protein [Gammaproteobacteria bacterium]
MKKYIKTSLLLFVFSILLTNCSAFRQYFHPTGSTEWSEEECMQVDFYQMGFNDGQAGKEKRNLENYVDEHGCRVTVNQAAYNAGWNKGMHDFCHPTYMMGLVNGRTGHRLDQADNRFKICTQYGFHFDDSQYHSGQTRGLKQYCTVERGWQIGSTGKPYPNICPSYLDNEFRAGWESGVRQYCGKNADAANLGKAGKPYPEICSPKMYPAFKEAYDKGIGEYIKRAK